MDIYLDCVEESAFPFSEEIVKNMIQTALSHLGIKKNYEISVLLVRDEEMQMINRERRGMDRTTDVLSFPVAETIPHPYRVLGEVVISIDKMEVQAEEIGHSVRDEFLRLLVHGILHLNGYDHEIGQKEEILMQKMEDEILEILYKLAD